MSEMEQLKWLWNNTFNPDHKAKILEGVAARADSETLKWFWNDTFNPDYKAKILEGVAARADSETLKWFWNNTFNPDHRDILLTAMTRNENTMQNRRIDSKASNTVKTGKFKYDLFISHASEDKEAFVRALASALTERGLKVWYDEFTLSIGDSLRRSIDYGLANSRYGVVVLSNNFFNKEWPQKELDGLVAREDGREKVILPIWHEISKEQIKQFSPMLADRVAISSKKGMTYIANEIFDVVHS